MSEPSAFRVRCPGCGRIYRIPLQKMPRKPVQAKCRVCGGMIPVKPPVQAKPSSTFTGSPEKAAVKPVMLACSECGHLVRVPAKKVPPVHKTYLCRQCGKRAYFYPPEVQEKKMDDPDAVFSGVPKRSWELLKPYLKTYFLHLLGFAFACIPLSFLIMLVEGSPVLYTMLSTAVVIAYLLFSVGIMKSALRITDREPLRYSDFQLLPEAVSYFMGMILASVAISIGTLFFIIPGLILGCYMMFYGFVIIDQGTGPVEALKRSMKLVRRGGLLNALLLLLKLYLIHLATVITFGAGLVVTVPLSLVVTARVYRDLSLLQKQDGGSETVRS